MPPRPLLPALSILNLLTNMIAICYCTLTTQVIEPVQPVWLLTPEIPAVLASSSSSIQPMQASTLPASKATLSLFITHLATEHMSYNKSSVPLSSTPHTCCNRHVPQVAK